MPEQKPRFERTGLPPDVMHLLDVPTTETDLRFERLAQLDEKMNALRLHLERLVRLPSGCSVVRHFL